VSVEKDSDDVWLGVKGQSNSEIAGSPRKIFRYRLACILQGVEHWMGKGDSPPTEPNQTPNTWKDCAGDTRRVLTSVVERETTLTYS
jgi:hypothetical protein